MAERRHSEEYYDVKTTVFNALIDTTRKQTAEYGGEKALELHRAWEASRMLGPAQLGGFSGSIHEALERMPEPPRGA